MKLRSFQERAPLVRIRTVAARTMGLRAIFYTGVAAVLMCSPAWGGVYDFTQVSPVGQPINLLGGAAIDSSGLVAWAYLNTIQTWNGSTVSTYTPGVTVQYNQIGIGLSDAGGISFTSYNGNSTGQVYSIPGSTLTSFAYPSQANTYFSSSATNGLVGGNYAGNTGFIWTGGSSYTDITYPGPHGQMYTYGVNSAGDVAGINSCCALGIAFLDKGGVFTQISIPGEPDGEILPYAVNNSDVVVGEAFDGTFQNGFVWHNGIGTVVNYPGASNTIIYGINSAGELVGEANFGGPFSTGIVFTATLDSGAPEPGTFVLLLGAGVLFGAVRKYRAIAVRHAD